MQPRLVIEFRHFVKLSVKFRDWGGYENPSNDLLQAAPDTEHILQHVERQLQPQFATKYKLTARSHDKARPKGCFRVSRMAKSGWASWYFDETRRYS